MLSGLTMLSVIFSSCDTVEEIPEAALPPQLLASHEPGIDYFGVRLSSDGNRVVVGTLSAINYIYEWNGSAWLQQARLVPDEIDTSSASFNAWTISGDRAVVRLQDGVYVYARDGSAWRQQARLPVSIDRGGVAIEGNRIVLGDPYHDDDRFTSGGAPGPGIVHVFDWDGSRWLKTASLLPSDGLNFDHFGMSVVLDGDHLAVFNVNFDEGSRLDNGRVHFFEWNSETWVESGIFGPLGSSYTNSIAIDSDRVIAGQVNGVYVDGYGQAIVFDWDGQAWRETVRVDIPTKCAAVSSNLFNGFGTTVALEDDIAVVGAPADPEASGEGTVYVYAWEGGQWNQIQKLKAPIPTPGARFGASLALARGVVFIGAPLDKANGSGTGAVYTYTLPR